MLPQKTHMMSRPASLPEVEELAILGKFKTKKNKKKKEEISKKKSKKEYSLSTAVADLYVLAGPGE
jgi:hypothetical protein